MKTRPIHLCSGKACLDPPSPSWYAAGMRQSFEQDLRKALDTAFLDASIEGSLAYRPRLIYNDLEGGEIVLTELLDHLRSCSEFKFSVAFITLGGLEMLLQAFKDIEGTDIKGELITSDFLSFNDPKALRKLLSIPFIETRIADGSNLHTKGYLFKERTGEYTTIIGSSNLTDRALKENKEWNLRTTSLEKGTLVQEFLTEFGKLKKESVPLTEAWIDEYELRYKERLQTAPRLPSVLLEPNYMQTRAAAALAKLREEGKDKALLIAATGTGKTYLSAFDVRAFKPKRMLFLVHREQILRNAAESFMDVLGQEIEADIGFYTGSGKQPDKRYVFATVQTMSRYCQRFSPEAFEYIVIDEVHKAGSESYSRIIKHFRPKFLLGMSATPDRPDAGKDKDDGIERNIYKLFDYNIAYEIRLQQAMEADLLCPFHYFGVSDVTVDGEPLSEASAFKYLVSDERLNHIIKQAEYYGHSGDRVKGLIFCSRKDEAAEIASKLSFRGYRAKALTGDNSQEEREAAVARLEQDEAKNALDYIVTVDIFNEGIDIPSVNQVLMLRPTQSPIVFIQQLGRGLRKAPRKEFVVIIDFIANYKNNFMIPIALSGDRTYNKDNLRRYVSEGSKLIAGTSTVNFDLVSKERIYKTIDNANFSELNLLKQEYFSLKEKLGHVPTLMDFEDYDAIDVARLMRKCGSYHAFLVKYDSKDYTVRLSKEEEEILEFMSAKIANGKRLSDIEVLETAINSMDCLETAEPEPEYGISNERLSTYAYLTNAFPAQEAVKRKYSNCVLIRKTGGKFLLSEAFRARLEGNPSFKALVTELLSFSRRRYEKRFSNRYEGTNLVLYEKYVYEDVCRLLNWKHAVNAQSIGGYWFDADTKTFAVFINYKKEEAEDVIKYEDRFLDEDNFIACSKKDRRLDSKDADRVFKRTPEYKDIKIYLFVRKNKDDNEAKEFYFLGEVEAVGEPMPDTQDGHPIFKIHYRLKQTVRKDIYDYLTLDVIPE